MGRSPTSRERAETGAPCPRDSAAGSCGDDLVGVLVTAGAAVGIVVHMRFWSGPRSSVRPPGMADSWPRYLNRLDDPGSIRSQRRHLISSGYQAVISPLRWWNGGNASINRWRLPPVDTQVCTVDIVGERAGDEGHQLRHLFGPPKSSHSLVAQHVFQSSPHRGAERLRVVHARRLLCVSRPATRY